MKDEFIRKESVREISWKMCPDCEKECEFYFETEKEIWSEANFNYEIEYEIVIGTIDKCSECGYNHKME
ncbi:hypothetical protein [Vibrio parahaemolyticus]|uniref:hypothetical protein n=1 Tax=Vibrio parahaemolyticus TaxID=670 RepID=UPI000410B0DD|nr:hypothetical protein [Vibrio parahaemolyticus]